MEPRVLLAIAGTTASGKSALALALAAERGAEIVSCDSVQVYRGFEIGCAKPTPEERAHVRHHLIDVAEWHEPFDARRYRELAAAAVADARGRGCAPLVVGGTGLYLRALRWGLVDAPGPDAALRAALYAEEASAPGALHRRLRELDPETARTTAATNLVRLVRALEITLKAGEPASRLRARHGFAAEEVPMRVVALDWPSSLLAERVHRRTAEMLTRGLLGEVEGLLARGISAAARPLRSLGYKEAADVVLGRARPAGLEERITRATLDYARRQRTWLRRERAVTWVSVRDLGDAAAFLRVLKLDDSRAMP